MTTRPADTDNYLSAPQIARRLGVGRTWAYERMHAGAFGPVTLLDGKLPRVTAAGLADYLARQPVTDPRTPARLRYRTAGDATPRTTAATVDRLAAIAERVAAG